MTNILTVNNLVKHYGNIQALKSVSFDVPPNTVFGILGPNGSGKTTLLGIVMDILKPTSGSILLNGQPATAAMRKHIGTLLETPNFYHYLSGRRNLEIAAAIKGNGHHHIMDVLRRVDLHTRANSKFSTYSLGMKQRLAIAAALLANPDILVLDEPTNGLDPVGIADIRQLITRLAAEGKTIIMASHLLDEVEKVCTHVAILKQGSLLACGPVNEILANEDIVELAAANNQQLVAVLQQMNGYSRLEPNGSYLHLFYPVGTANPASINQHCFARGVTLTHLQLKKKSLETKFLELTNQ